MPLSASTLSGLMTCPTQHFLSREAGDDVPFVEIARELARMVFLAHGYKVCDAAKQCQDLGQLSDLLATSRKPDELLAAWQGWHDTVGRAVRPLWLAHGKIAMNRQWNLAARSIGCSSLVSSDSNHSPSVTASKGLFFSDSSRMAR